MAELAKLMADGKLKAKISYYEGLEEAPRALRDLLLGKNQGKVMVRVDKDAPSAKL